MSDVSHLRQHCKMLADMAGCGRWQIVHDTVADRYVVVLGHDSDDEMRLQDAALTALKDLE